MGWIIISSWNFTHHWESVQSTVEAHTIDIRDVQRDLKNEHEVNYRNNLEVQKHLSYIEGQNEAIFRKVKNQ